MFLKVCSSYVPIFPGGGGGSYRFQEGLSPCNQESSNFPCVEFSDFYVNQSLAGQTIQHLERRLSSICPFSVLVFGNN
jgi:hypothetical protein